MPDICTPAISTPPARQAAGVSGKDTGLLTEAKRRHLRVFRSRRKILSEFGIAMLPWPL